MEALGTIGLVANIAQFIEFGGKLISKSTELYQSTDDVLAENLALELATNHLVLLNDKLKDGAITNSDDALKRLCEACHGAAEDLLAALKKIKVQGSKTRWKSFRKALRSVWSKEQICDLEGRVAGFREELNLHLTVELRYVILLTVLTES